MIGFAVRRPVAIMMICVAIALLGFISLSKIPVQLMPNIDPTDYAIITSYSGGTPEEIETQITTPIERSVSTIPGLNRTTSVSLPERSEIRVSFSGKVDPVETLSLLRDRLESAGLPDGAGRPKIVRNQVNSEPVIRAVFRTKSGGPINSDIARLTSEILVRRIESIDGVALAQLSGAPKKILNIEVLPSALLTYNISLNTVAEVIQSRNRTYPAGEVQFEGVQAPIKIGQAIKGIDELKAIVIKKDGSRSTRLGDVAQIEEKLVPSDVRSRLNGQESLLLNIRKEAEANTVEVAARSQEVISRFLAEYSDKILGEVLVDQGSEVQAAVHHVSESVIVGGLLAALTVFLLVQSLWPTFVVSLSIPLSLLLTLVMMYFTGMSFNVMSLAGLALGVGMLVDNSTVVLGSIHNVQSKLGDLKQSALTGAQNVVGAVTASTLSIMAVFGPLVFVDGVVGRIFRDVALTVCYSIAASLFVAAVVIPMLCGLDRNKGSKSEAPQTGSWNAKLPWGQFGSAQGAVSSYWSELARPVLLGWRTTAFSLSTLWLLSVQSLSLISQKILPIFSQGFESVTQKILPPIAKLLGLTEDYIQKMLPILIKTPRPIYRWSVGLTILALITLRFLGAELFPDESYNRLTYNMELPTGTTLGRSEKMVQSLEKKLRSLSHVETISTQIGENGSHTSSITIVADPEHLAELETQSTAILQRVPDLKYSRQKKALVGEGKPVQVELYADDLNLLREKTELVKLALLKTPGLSEVETSLRPDLNEINIEFSKERLAVYNIDPQAFVGPMRAYLQGVPAGLLPLSGEELQIRVSAPRAYFSEIGNIRNFGATQEDDRRIYLSQVSDIKEHQVQGAIEHIDRKRVARLIANLDGIDIESAMKQIAKIVPAQLDGSNVSWKPGGQDEERKKSMQSLLVAVGFSILLIYLLLAAQFENMVQPGIILCAVPLCLIGVAAGLLVCGMNMSALVFVGFIILVGVSVNTSIVMVDFANHLMTEGKSAAQAITESTVQRLRPIIVTTACNVFGHLPMAMAFGQGASIQRPLAVTVIGGIISSTILTLLVVPPIYVRLTERSKRRSAGLETARANQSAGNNVVAA